MYKLPKDVVNIIYRFLHRERLNKLLHCDYKNRVLATHLDDRVVYRNINGLLHREDGPAIEYANGNKIWYINGELHREDGPAVEYARGDKEWYIEGQRYLEDEFNKKMNIVKKSIFNVIIDFFINMNKLPKYCCINGNYIVKKDHPPW